MTLQKWRKRVEEEPVPAAEQHTLRVLNRRGDSPVTWTPGSKVEEEATEIIVKKMMRDGIAVFDEDTQERVTEFDPAARRLIAIPPIAGG